MADHVINPSQSSNIHTYPFLSCELWRRPLVTVNDALGATANAPYHVISNILDIGDPDLPIHYTTFIRYDDD